MAKPPTKLQALQRDGTSQAGRQQAALDPDYVSVDERSPRDLLAFAWDYAKELKYFDEDERAAGDWGAFLGLDRELDLDLEEDREAFLAYLDEADAFMAAPEGFAPDRAWRFKRPHFALFLAFLQLLGHARNELNTLTRRHLDFYYRHVLRMTKKAAVPDRVNVMLEPAAGVEQVELPAGSLFAAGQDDLGQERVYRSDRGIVVNRARIARLSSVFADRRITGIREGRELAKGTTKDRFLEMLSIALGDPLPGDPLPPYAEDRPVDFALLENLRGVVDFAPDSLGLKHFELRELILMKRRRDGADDEWREINRLLEKAGRKRQASS